MKIINPTDNKIEIQIKGIQYSIEPKDFITGIADDVASHWKDIHGFLTMEVEKIETPIEEDIEPIQEEVVEPEVVEELEEMKEMEAMEEVVAPEVEVKSRKNKSNKK